MRWAKKILGVFSLVAGAIAALQAITPVYRFPSPSPFRGTGWYNPFLGETLVWSRANFHIHSRTWGGITNGYQLPPEIRHVYDSLGYEWIGISDYQSINPESPLPLYEHGWSVGKVHQLCFWPKEVRWWDYPLFQTLSAKQHVLRLLRPTTEFLVIAHPRLLHSYTGEELSKLGGYDAIEVLNRYGDSVAEWDSALSSGHYAPILANDNVHDVYNPHQVMSRWTEVALPKGASLEELKRALLAGRTVGYKNRTPFPIQKPYPLFTQIQVWGDTEVILRTSMVVDSLRLIGQGGRVRAVAYHTDSLAYRIQAEDTYLRPEAFTAAVEAYGSPLVRGEPCRRPVPPIDKTLTLLSSVLWGAISVGLILVGALQFRSKRDKR